MCGAPVQTLDLEGIDVAKESIVQGTVIQGGDPLGGAYVRLLDSTGEFTAEVQTSTAGAFRFFAAPGDWTLRTLYRGILGLASVLYYVSLPFIAVAVIGFFGGLISDRRKQRKIFVYLAGGAQAFVALVFIVFFPTAIPLVFALGVAYGVGYGLYYAVDWALACDTLPDKSKSAKDMGLFHIALTLPQAIIPFFGGRVIDYFNNHVAPNSGYRVLFSSAIVFLFLGTILVSRIKTVR